MRSLTRGVFQARLVEDTTIGDKGVICSSSPPAGRALSQSSTSSGLYRTSEPIFRNLGPRRSRRQRRTQATLTWRCLDNSISVNSESGIVFSGLRLAIQDRPRLHVMDSSVTPIPLDAKYLPVAIYQKFSQPCGHDRPPAAAFSIQRYVHVPDMQPPFSSDLCLRHLSPSIYEGMGEVGI
jgi:hypothetical protein